MLSKYSDIYANYKIQVTIIRPKSIEAPTFKDFFRVFHSQLPMDNHVIDLADIPTIKR